MIFALKGKLIAKNGLQIVVDVSGVGYGVWTPMGTLLNLPKIGEEIFLFTHLIIREDLYNLYGFLTQREKFLFCELIKINGLGGKIAITILSHLNIEQFLEAIKLQNLDKLIKIPGIGKKIAQRLILEMQNSLNNKKFKESLDINYSSDAMINFDQPELDGVILNDVQEALLALGYKPKEAFLAVKKVMNNKDIKYNSSEKLLKATLKFLSQACYD